MKNLLSSLFLLLAMLMSTGIQAQDKLTLENIKSVSLRNSGTIMTAGEVKGYFFFYVSDKIDKHTNEYTIQLLDENLKLIKKIIFTDDSKEQLLETSFNSNSLMFMFFNEDTKMITNKIYSLEGKLKLTYPKELDKKSLSYIKSGMATSMNNEEGQNNYLHDIEGKGYFSLIPQRDGKDYSYEISIYSSDKRKQFIYTPDSEVKFEVATFLGATDSLLVFEVLKKNRLLSNKLESWLLGINLENGKKAFEITTETPEYKYYPMNIAALNGKSDFLVLGTYYDKDDKVLKDKTLGISALTLNTKGVVMSKKFNSWESDFSKYMKVNANGKVEDLGYIYFHKLIQTEDGNMFAVGEGYKKTANAGGIALTALAALGGGVAMGNATKLTITDMVLIRFNNQFAVNDVTIYEKNKNSAGIPGADFASPHMLAAAAKTYGSYDYDFTQTDKFHTNFFVGYKDYERNKDYKGVTFHSISYNNGKITTDKINLASKASSMRIMPGKTGFIMITEYFKKDKKLELRMEKIN